MVTQFHGNLIDQIERWFRYADKLHRLGEAMFMNVTVPVTAKGAGDVKVLAMTLLARSMSNLKSALILIRIRRLVDARILVRCCLENEFWIAGLVKEGDKFVDDMLHDEMKHRLMQGQNLMRSDLVDKASQSVTNLRLWMRDNKKWADSKTLTPKEVAGRGVIGKLYLLYEYLSSDVAHPSLMSLQRYLVPTDANGVRGMDFNPLPKDEEIIMALDDACLVAIGILTGTNEILGGTPEGEKLNAITDEYAGLVSLRQPTDSATTNKSKVSEPLG